MGRKLPAAHPQAVFSGNCGFRSQAASITGTRTSDKIVGEGVEQLPAGNILTGHAEVLACQQAIETLQVRSLEKAILYSTAEPCFMCSYVIRQCRIAKVVYGTKTAMIGGITSSFPILAALDLNAWRPSPQVIGGILAEECRRLHSH